MSTRKSGNPDQSEQNQRNGAADDLGPSLARGSSPDTKLKAMARLLARQGAREWMTGASSRTNTGSMADSNSGRGPNNEMEGE